MHTGIRQPAKDKKQVGEKNGDVCCFQWHEPFAWNIFECIEWLHWMQRFQRTACIFIYIVQFSHHPTYRWKIFCELAFGFVTKKNDNLNFRAEEIDWQDFCLHDWRLAEHWFLQKEKLKKKITAAKHRTCPNGICKKIYRRESTQRIKRIPAPQKHSNQSAKLVATMTVP